MPESIITISERFDKVKRRAADTDCQLPQEESQKFRENLSWLLQKIEDSVEHERDKCGID